MATTPTTSPAHRALSDRLKAKFQQPDSDDDSNASQDWFVNDVREATPVMDNNNLTPREPQQEPVQGKISSTTPTTRNRSSFSETEEDEALLLKTKTGFMHLRPLVSSVLIMEICNSEPAMQKMYGSKYFKIYLPQVVDSQIEFCLFCRKRVGKNKIRFTLSETNISKWNNPFYIGKLDLFKTSRGHKYRIVCPKRSQRTVFTIEQDNRKCELKNQLINLFQKLKSHDEAPQSTVTCHLQKFINPVADVRCQTTNVSLLQINREGDASYGKHFITYMRPFSMFTSACIAVAMESHLLDP